MENHILGIRIDRPRDLATSDYNRIRAREEKSVRRVERGAGVRHRPAGSARVGDLQGIATVTSDGRIRSQIEHNIISGRRGIISRARGHGIFFGGAQQTNTFGRIVGGEPDAGAGRRRIGQGSLQDRGLRGSQGSTAVENTTARNGCRGEIDGAYASAGRRAEIGPAE